MGPGGANTATGEQWRGTVIDGTLVAGDTAQQADWVTRAEATANTMIGIEPNQNIVRPVVLAATHGKTHLSSLQAAFGNLNLYEGPVVTFFGVTGLYAPDFFPMLDGLMIKGGHQDGILRPPTPFVPGAGQPAAAEVTGVAGGGVYLHTNVAHLRITNNLLQQNSAAMGGAVRAGTPFLAETTFDNNNDFLYVGHNRLIGNGGAAMAGQIGLFDGTESYEIAHNLICGGYSAEYGGGISHQVQIVRAVARNLTCLTGSEPERSHPPQPFDVQHRLRRRRRCHDRWNTALWHFDPQQRQRRRGGLSQPYGSQSWQ